MKITPETVRADERGEYFAGCALIVSAPPGPTELTSAASISRDARGMLAESQRASWTHARSTLAACLLRRAVHPLSCAGSPGRPLTCSQLNIWIVSIARACAYID
jgi:hypothetical protein